MYQPDCRSWPSRRGPAGASSDSSATTSSCPTRRCPSTSPPWKTPDYIEVVKDFVGKKGRTRITITDTGREAYDGYVVTLRSILDPSEARPHVRS